MNLNVNLLLMHNIACNIVLIIQKIQNKLNFFYFMYAHTFYTNIIKKKHTQKFYDLNDEFIFF